MADSNVVKGNAVNDNTAAMPYLTGMQRENGWIQGAALLTPAAGAFQSLLGTISGCMGTDNRRVIAASFALRYGWSAGAPLQSFIQHGSVMNIALDNISLHFCHAGLYRDYSLHQPDVVYHAGKYPLHDEEAIAVMAGQLYTQAQPVIEKLHEWSRFSRRALWAMTVSSWASQCVRVAESVWNDRNAGYVLAECILQHNKDLYRNKPVFYGMQYGAEQRLFQKRQACCLYYLGLDRSFCTSCPLIGDEERTERSYRYLHEYGSQSTSH